jgi:hypothetical protein
MNVSPARVIARLLVEDGLGISGTLSTGDWRTYTHTVSEEGGDQAIFVSGSPGRLEGGNVRDGANTEHYGIQVKIRGRDPEAVVVKLQAVEKYLTTNVKQRLITVGSFNFLVHAVSLVSSVLPLGQEEKSRRFLFSSNFAATIQEL